MGHRLDPTPFNRIRQALQPDWVHSARARRVIAAGLVLLAAAAALRAEPGGAHRDAIVATQDLRPGVVITAQDVVVQQRPVDTLPDGALGDIGAAVGATPAGAVRPGEVITDVRVLGPRLTESAAGPDARVVPVQLTSSAILDLIREGDVVDIVAVPAGGPAPDASTTPRIVATDAVVVLVSPEAGGLGGRSDRVVLVALPAAAATAVAAAALGEAVTLTLH
jgi:Flp pilus assembly protein CpaB